MDHRDDWTCHATEGLALIGTATSEATTRSTLPISVPPRQEGVACRCQSRPNWGKIPGVEARRGPSRPVEA